MFLLQYIFVCDEGSNFFLDARNHLDAVSQTKITYSKYLWLSEGLLKICLCNIMFQQVCEKTAQLASV
jgi:hypothetical protein